MASQPGRRADARGAVPKRLPDQIPGGTLLFIGRLDVARPPGAAEVLADETAARRRQCRYRREQLFSLR